MTRIHSKSLVSLVAAALLLPSGLVAGAGAASARERVYKDCRHSSGTTGLIAGGTGGALVGHALLGGPVGIAAGAVGGAFAGRAIDRSATAKRRCHYVRHRD